MRNKLIGIFVIAAIGVATLIILFLNPELGDGKKNIEVYFANISNIKIGTRVTLAGQPVGVVKSVEKTPNSRQSLSDIYGNPYFYKLTLKVDSSVDIYETDEISIQTSGIVGEKTVAIVPKCNLSPKLAIGPIYAKSPEDFQYTLSELITHTKKTISEFNTILADIKEKELVAKFDVLVSKDVKSLIQNLDDLTLANGTVGKLIQSDDFYQRMSTLIKKVDTLASDITNYGLLFQYNKQWQRKKAKGRSD